MADSVDKSQEMRAERIKKLREEFGFSKADMARMCGITQTAYTNIENAETRSITIETGKKIANSLKISFFDLFDIDGDSQKIDSLKNEIETLKKRINELEEQLNDKRQLIQFLSDRSEILKEFAWTIYCGELETNLSSNESTNKGVFSKQFDREDFMRYHAIEYLKKCYDEGRIISSRADSFNNPR